MFCPCGNALSGRQRSYCSPACKERYRAKRPSGYARLSEDQREDRLRGRAEDRREERRLRDENRVVIGVDGEGSNEEGYFLLAAANEAWSDHVWSDEGLSTRECFRFLTGLPKDWTKWFYAGGYDVNMMLVDVSEAALRRLHATTWLRWREFKVNWIPGKKLWVGRFEFDPVTRRQGKQLASCTVWDMFPWQQRRFVAWVEDNHLASPDVVDRISSMKDQRSAFDTSGRKEITEYCLEECRILAKGAGQIHDMLVSSEVGLSKFYSPASVSKYLMRSNGVDLHRSKHNPTPPVVSSIIDRAYFGGRAETCRVGPIDGPLYMYDIRSAYPFAMQDVPCWAHGRWEQGSWDGDAAALLDVSWKAPRALWAPLPVRPRTGSLKWPTEARGWFWANEVRGTSHLGKVEHHGAWIWRQDCDCRPFAYVQDLYEERRQLKKAGEAREYVLKLGMNATYGATAEHKRSNREDGEPYWKEPGWAGFITAHTRGLIGALLGPSTILVATDGILTSAPLDVPIGSALGEWEVEEYERGFVVGPGVYFLYRDGAWSKFKSRGIDARSFNAEDFEALWSEQGREGKLVIPQRRFIGLGTALHRIHGFEPPGQECWRKFIEYESVRSLSLVPRRQWLTKDRWDGRSLAPPLKLVEKGSRADTLKAVALNVAYQREKDPMTRVRLLHSLASISESDTGKERSIFPEWDQEF